MRGDYTEGEEEGINDDTGGLVELVDGIPHHDGSIHRTTVSPLAFKES